MTKHFLSLSDIGSDILFRIINRAIALKHMPLHVQPKCLQDQVIALVFEKESTRTRTSFETAAVNFGGRAITLDARDSHLGRNESLQDMARVLSTMVKMVVFRTNSHNRLLALASQATIPVINGLCDRHHPCQLLADVQTIVEHFRKISGLRIAWIGDGNNVCNSWIEAAGLFDFELQVATPAGYAPNLADSSANKNICLAESPVAAVMNADVVVTDAWISMGQESEREKRVKDFSGYTVDKNLMSKAKPSAIFLHCLPAYRGYEATAEVIDGPQSLIWQEAGNRLHAQKALIEYLL